MYEERGHKWFLTSYQQIPITLAIYRLAIRVVKRRLEVRDEDCVREITKWVT